MAAMVNGARAAGSWWEASGESLDMSLGLARGGASTHGTWRCRPATDGAVRPTDVPPADGVSAVTSRRFARRSGNAGAVTLAPAPYALHLEHEILQVVGGDTWNASRLGQRTRTLRRQLLARLE
jgi:hypothetical protein